ncbi:MAG: aminomethyl-transferring glycine dehydrogenase [Actinobacteria bacterium]|nr:aminomethyl-transferring glycine dehydrogenase [Actinomycetota bacterium]
MTTTPQTRLAAEGDPSFAARHIGPRDAEISTMLSAIGYPSVSALIDAAVPHGIRSAGLDLPEALSEEEVLAELRRIAGANRPRIPLLGMGYYGTKMPAVIRRNLVENPAWYTAYTPYQPEISQGRLQALLMFQTVVEDLTGLPLANASMLDEPTAAAEAMTLARRVGTSASARFAVDADTHPATLAVLATRAEPLGIELVVFDPADEPRPDDVFGVLLSYPGSSGAVADVSAQVAAAHDAGAIVVVASDLLALTLLTPPGEFGADIVVGSAQRFGVPMGFGGPHAGFMATKSSMARSLPGRLVGVSKDADGNPAYRLALQTREQHIRREKATSNICTAQVLLAVVAAMYAAYHGPVGLRAIAEAVANRAGRLAEALRDAGYVTSGSYFDTVSVEVPQRAAEVVGDLRSSGFDIRALDADRISIALDETTDDATLAALTQALSAALGTALHLPDAATDGIPAGLRRTSDFLTHPWFNSYHSETAMMRFLRRLSDADLALDRTMIPLGSCTMKLNAAAEMEAITWPEFADVHPFAPADESVGYAELITALESWLVEITGYDAVSVQPNAGSQGEFAGLLAIRAFHTSQGDAQRDVCLIPSSAHGTNAASAVMAGLRVVVVACDDEGNIDLDDLAAKIADNADRVAALMITYPSTHGVFEAEVQRVCQMVHDAGGQVYLDGANLNALVGLAAPGEFGADVSHLNLHKTFCIPHGGGGPGVGPVAVREHLAPFLPGHPLRPDAGPSGRGFDDGGVGPVSGAPWGSAGVLPIPYAYVRMMGAQGLTRATEVAILAANYIAARLRDHYPVLYTGPSGLVAHECIIDIRPITKSSGVTVDDIAKRLIDYGFHAPTMSFPVAGTLMIEPTESEDLAELDRFVDAMIAIRAEVDRVVDGEWEVAASPLRQAPHTGDCITGDWDRPYTRAEAVFPPGVSKSAKYWPPVRRIDGAFGDRNLACACPAPEAFE